MGKMQKSIVRYSLPDTFADESPPEGMRALLWRIYRTRGVEKPEDVRCDLGSLLSPTQMHGLDDAVDLLVGALKAQTRILVVGDFDADGATSCALAVLTLRALGYRYVDYLVPNRFTFGYGLTPEIVEHAKPRDPELLITVDNGISSVAGVAAANALGWQVIVTDHHLPGAELPAAAAMVNPNLPSNPFPSKALAGVGVLFYVLLGLRARLRSDGWFETPSVQEPNLADYLDLVALGTVADVVGLDRNNRILVHQGLRRIRAGRCRPGITALLRIAGRNPARTQASDLGFAAGPRLNAAGRLEDMSLGIECLLAEDADEAHRLAVELDRLNRERRTIETEMQAQAEAMLGNWAPEDDQTLPWGLCLYREEWHPGVIGILASRIKERWHRPTIAFASNGDGMVRGSGRSIPGLHIRDALDEVAAAHPQLLSKFGGHAMAAGMTLRAEDFEAFAKAFDEIVRRHLTVEDMQATLRSDGRIDAADLHLDTAQAILEGGPWGQGFEEPLFDDVFDVVNHRIVGERHWKLVLAPQGVPQHLVDAIAFYAVDEWPEMPKRVRAAYRLDANEWQGRVDLQLRIEYLEEAEHHD